MQTTNCAFSNTVSTLSPNYACLEMVVMGTSELSLYPIDCWTHFSLSVEQLPPKLPPVSTAVAGRFWMNQDYLASPRFSPDLFGAAGTNYGIAQLNVRSFAQGHSETSTKHQA